MPATERGLQERLERNRKIYSSIRSRGGRIFWRPLLTLTGMTRPRLSRGLRDLERYSVIERVWIGTERKWMYVLTGQELTPLEPFYKKSKVSRTYKDYSEGMKVIPVTVRSTRRRTLPWKSVGSDKSPPMS